MKQELSENKKEMGRIVVPRAATNLTLKKNVPIGGLSSYDCFVYRDQNV